MATIIDRVGVRPTRVRKAKSEGGKKQQTWLAGQSTAVGERPLGDYEEFYDALGRLADATDELEQGNNIGFTAKVRPVLMDIIIGLSPNAGAPVFYLVTADELSEEAREKLVEENEESDESAESDDDDDAEAQED